MSWKKHTGAVLPGLGSSSANAPVSNPSPSPGVASLLPADFATLAQPFSPIPIVGMTPLKSSSKIAPTSSGGEESDSSAGHAKSTRKQPSRRTCLLSELPKRLKRGSSDDKDIIPSPISPLPERSLQEMEGKEIQENMAARIFPGDLKMINKQDRDTHQRGICQAIEWLGVRAISNFQRLDAVEAEAKAHKDKCGGLEAELQEVKSELEQVKAERDSLESELTRSHRCRDEEMARMTVELTEAKNRWARDTQRERREAYFFGAKDSSLQFFMLPVGHKFLQIMYQETLSAFRGTPECLVVLAPAMGLLINDVGNLVMNQIHASPEQKALFNSKLVIDSVDSDALDRCLGIDKDAPPGPAWWIPVLDRALELFIERGCPDPLLPSVPFIRSPYLDSIQVSARGLIPPEADGRVFYPPAVANLAALDVVARLHKGHLDVQVPNAILGFQEAAPVE